MKTFAYLLQLVTSAIALTLVSCSNLETTSSLDSNSESKPISTASTAIDSSNNNLASNLSANSTGQRFKKVVLAKGLERPWGMASLPDGSILITERVGKVKLFRNRSVKQVEISGIPDLFVSGQGGLMDISLHPRFRDNNLVYLTYSKGNFQANHTSILRVKFDGKSLIEPKVIFEVKPDKTGNQHFGSRIVWLPDETMLIAIGDGGNPPLQLEGELVRKQAQKLDSQLGKILRLKDDGSIPKDNPFIEAEKANPFVWSYGHRNIQGLFADNVSGKIWATEHGSRGGDELNLVKAGKNYGWPIVTFSQEYTGGSISEDTSRPDMVDPKLVWTPAIAPSGLVLYRGDRLPLWKGNLFVGGLVSKEVIRIKIENDQPVIKETIPIGQRVRDVREGIDGCIYILTDEKSGQLIRLEPI